ncbi:MAG TPA: HAD hydrolase family protein [Candidatus Acidoferrales bacterium]|jgi:mannosyl-3-phosphoglycerate phosphatase family protein|nr:HAD hydrolase family protein [Candidatus Acidoferrales bacterium]
MYGTPRFQASLSHVTLLGVLLAPRHLIFTALEGALIDSRTGSSAGAEEALSELERRKIPFVLLTSRTREEIEPIRRKLGHNHPFVAENGGGIFFPDGYFSLRIPGAVRTARYLSIAQGRPYAEVCEALDEIAEECAVGVAGFHHMSLREIADNTGLRPRDAELARAREFDEPFYFTSADDKAVARFVEAAHARGFDTRHGHTFWHLSAKCDAARAVRTLAKLFREATHIKLRLVGIGGGQEDLPWLRAMDHAMLLPDSRETANSPEPRQENPVRTGAIVMGDAPGAAGWNKEILNIID